MPGDDEAPWLVTRARTALAAPWRRIAGSWSMPLRVAITLVLLGVVLLRSNVGSLPNAIGHANLVLLLAMLGCSYLVWVVNTYRWQRILAGFRVRFEFAELYRLNLSSVFYGLALPGQLSGELVKAVRLGNRVQQRRVVYVSVFLDRIYGMLGLALLGGAALLVDPPPADWLGLGPSRVVLLGVTLASAGVLGLPWLARHGWLAGTHPIARRLIAAVCGAITVDGIPPPVSALVVGCVLGVAAQALTAATQWGMALALGLSISPLVLTWILTVSTILGMFPISIAGLGVREATYVGLLSLFGVPAASALTLSFTMFGVFIALGLTGAALDLTRRNAVDGREYAQNGPAEHADS